MANSDNANKNLGSKDDEIDLHQLWDVLSFNKYKIIASGGFGALLALIYLVLATPIYEANALVQVEAAKQNQILGDVQSLLGGVSTKSDAEINLARSRMVLGRTVDELNTDQVIAYDSFPMLEWFNRPELKAEEALKLNVFSVPQMFENVQLKLVYHGNNKYSLTIPEVGSKPEIKVDGELGKLLSTQGLLLNISQLKAESGQEFILIKQSKLAAIESVKSNLSVGDVGKDTGILVFNYVGIDKNKIQNILNSIVKNYEHQDKEFGILSAGQSLEFIEKQLPLTKKSLKEAEDKLNEFRHKKKCYFRLNA